MPDREPIKASEQYLKDKFGKFIPWKYLYVKQENLLPWKFKILAGIPKLSLNILSLSSGSGGCDLGIIQASLNLRRLQ